MKIQIPTDCPSCSSSLDVVNFQLFCRNTSCPAQSSKKVEAFVKNMKIKGLGPKTIERLELVSLSEIYELDKTYLIDTLGKVGETIFNNIQGSRISDFHTFLASLSITLIGKTASSKIARECNSLSHINESSLTKAGIKGRAAESLLNWLEQNLFEYAALPINFTEMVKPVSPTKNLGKVCITGKLADFANRTQAKACLEELGYTVVGTVSKTLDFLVDEQDSMSSKNTKAKNLNITITTMQHLINVAGENNV